MSTLKSPLTSPRTFAYAAKDEVDVLRAVRPALFSSVHADESMLAL